jgi:hypothetical protein
MNKTKSEKGGEKNFSPEKKAKEVTRNQYP